MKPTIARIQTTIKKQGQLTMSRSNYLQQNIALFGPKTLLPASRTIAARVAKPGAIQPKSSMLVIGEAPDGFGKEVSWDPNDAELALVVFLNAGDPFGVTISNVKATDTIKFISATGIASFAEETENEGVGSIIGIVAAGAIVSSSVFGAPELAPFIGAAEKYAKERFQERKVKTKRRDPFGEDPSTGHKARQEGGVIVCLPGAGTGTVYYSGNSDSEKRWIKKPGARDYAHLPDHVKRAFFLERGSGSERTAGEDGDIIIAPWDYSFTDNFGFYRLHILLKRGNGQSPVIE